MYFVSIFMLLYMLWKEKVTTFDNWTANGRWYPCSPHVDSVSFRIRTAFQNPDVDLELPGGNCREQNLDLSGRGGMVMLV